MNLHSIKNGIEWVAAHIYAYPLPARCSECPGVTIRNQYDHLAVHIGMNAETWVCECRDQAHGERACLVLMASEDANVRSAGGRWVPLDESFPYVYVCPDCRNEEHIHGVRRYGR